MLLELVVNSNNFGMITLQDAITASGSHPERLTHPELTSEVKANLTKLLEKVNALLKELTIEHVVVSSGFRPSDVNAATPGSAKKSLHMSGNAIDIAGHIVYNELENHGDLLKKYGLWREDKSGAPTWTHLDQSTTRVDRTSRTFIA